MSSDVRHDTSGGYFQISDAGIPWEFNIEIAPVEETSSNIAGIRADLEIADMTTNSSRTVGASRGVEAAIAPPSDIRQIHATSDLQTYRLWPMHLIVRGSAWSFSAETPILATCLGLDTCPEHSEPLQ